MALDHDCREGTCGMCSLFINGEARGPDCGVVTCQLHMRMSKNGDIITIKPWRTITFPIIRDLMVGRTAFERVQQVGGYISVNTPGSTQDANAIPILRRGADRSMDAVACIGCGACVVTCENPSAMLLVAAEVSQFVLLSQGRVEATERIPDMVNQMEHEGLGNCTNTGTCEVECPKGILSESITCLSRGYLKAGTR